MGSLSHLTLSSLMREYYFQPGGVQACEYGNIFSSCDGSGGCMQHMLYLKAFPSTVVSLSAWG